MASDRELDVPGKGGELAVSGGGGGGGGGGKGRRRLVPQFYANEN